MLADMNDLLDCLAHLGGRPLKIIVPECYEDEREHDGGKWGFRAHEGTLHEKDVFVTAHDRFQVSVANEHTAQEMHTHAHLTEVYISHAKMVMDYGDEEHATGKEGGIIIVPPGRPHRATLFGLAFVLQVSDRHVADDKDASSNSSFDRP